MCVWMYYNVYGYQIPIGFVYYLFLVSVGFAYVISLYSSVMMKLSVHIMHIGMSLLTLHYSNLLPRSILWSLVHDYRVASLPSIAPCIITANKQGIFLILIHQFRF